MKRNRVTQIRYTLLKRQKSEAEFDGQILLAKGKVTIVHRRKDAVPRKKKLKDGNFVCVGGSAWWE